ncbi:glycoside hydrolase family 30 protein [Moniliophthora roreri]|nr:glycoside hydrolase family 30 protein [Moniliophthora roreri]
MWPLISTILALSACCRLCAGQQINDIWQTTWDRSSLFTSLSPSSPINFGPSGSSSNLSIQVDDTSIAQEIVGFGGSLTDSSALVLNNLKSRNPDNYQNLLRYMFDETDGANAAGLTYVRVPIGALYSLDDVSGDTSFSQFDINRAPSYLFSVLKDILSVNSRIKVHIVPWSPPGWMKDTGTMTGGTLRSDMVQYYSTYLLKAAQAYQEMGIPLYAISIQNEPMNDNPTYPTCTMTPSMEGQIGMSLRDQLNSNGLENVKIIGFDHNWVYAGDYPISLMEGYESAFDGVSFHCYEGVVANQDLFHQAFPSKLDWKPRALFGICKPKDAQLLIITELVYAFLQGLMWNIALDGNGNPMLSSSSSCKPPCRALVNVEDDGSYSFNQEFTSMAHVAKATIPKDVGGPFARRIGVGLSGSLGWAVRVGAFVTERSSSSELPRYSLVVLNWYDNASSEWNPVPIEATIDFRGVQATYTFPVGITTMSWYA